MYPKNSTYILKKKKPVTLRLQTPSVQDNNMKGISHTIENMNHSTYRSFFHSLQLQRSAPPGAMLAQLTY